MLRAKRKVGGVSRTPPLVRRAAQTLARHRTGRARIQSLALANNLSDKRKTSDESVIFIGQKWLESGKNPIADSALVSSSDEENCRAKSSEI
jgi:hypothetical protein